MEDSTAAREPMSAGRGYLLVYLAHSQAEGTWWFDQSNDPDLRYGIQTWGLCRANVGLGKALLSTCSLLPTTGVATTGVATKATATTSQATSGCMSG